MIIIIYSLSTTEQKSIYFLFHITSCRMPIVFFSSILINIRCSILFQVLLQVSWIRHRDVHLLTVGRYTYTSDQRFKAIHNPHSEDWTLQVSFQTQHQLKQNHQHHNSNRFNQNHTESWKTEISLFTIEALNPKVLTVRNFFREYCTIRINVAGAYQHA